MLDGEANRARFEEQVEIILRGAPADIVAYPKEVEALYPGRKHVMIAWALETPRNLMPQQVTRFAHEVMPAFPVIEEARVHVLRRDRWQLASTRRAAPCWTNSWWTPPPKQESRCGRGSPWTTSCSTPGASPAFEAVVEAGRRSPSGRGS